MIKTLIIDLPKPKPKNAPRRRGSNSLGVAGGVKMISVRFGQYDMTILEQAANLMELPISELVREFSLRCAKALCHGPPGSHPFSRRFTEGAGSSLFPDDGK